MGRVIKNEVADGEATQTDTILRFRSFLQGNMTWAQVEGMSWQEAKAIAQVGCDLAAAGRMEEARIIFEGLVEGNPKDSAMHSALGTVYQKLGRIEDAMLSYNTAVELEPKNPVALGNRGELRLKSGDRKGFGDLALAVEADPHGETNAGRRSKALVKAITMKAVEYVKQEQAQTK